MGTRLTRECMDTPIVLFEAGRTLEIKSMEAGREMADQDKKRTAPRITAIQLGTKITTR
jgi:hypothetical protein